MTSINVLIPMAGRGSRFREAGHALPKPMIPVAGKPMIEWAIDSLTGLRAEHRFIFVALEEDLRAGLSTLLEDKGEIVSLHQLREGAVQSALAARHLIESDHPLIIANCDQYIEWDINEWLDGSAGFDCSTVAFRSNNSHHSYLVTREKQVEVVREKEVVSDLAVAGMYFYRRGTLFTQGADSLIASDEKTNGEFYISPIFNQLIAEGATVTFTEIQRKDSHMLGTPEEVADFESLVKQGKL